jgi:hypothetical protein
MKSAEDVGGIKMDAYSLPDFEYPDLIKVPEHP